MKNISLLTVLLLFFALTVQSQSARERSVEVSAVVQESPPQITFTWTPDPGVSTYQIYKKSYGASDWGTAIAVIPSIQNTFVDANVAVGEAYEYAFFKKAYEPVKDTICVPAGTEVKFSLNDMYGIGLCCNFGFGYYQIEACEELVAEGDDFGFSDEVVFTVCDDGASCTEVIITVAPDMFPNSTSWTLTDNQTAMELGNSGGVGSFISDRPRYGYIYAGIRAPAIEDRGKILVLIDDEYTDTLDYEIERLRMDLVRDGWQVVLREANKDDAVTAVKALIQQVYAEHPVLNALFLLGHIPVPYSGDMYPDTHSENHQGAWSADTYYADLNGEWTDETANITTAFFERNHNIPGDGRFDQSAIPDGELELQHGRVDFYNMNVFPYSEIELTRRYLDKDHLWRNGLIEVQRRGLIDDNFGNAFAAPAASGWRNFAAMFGAENVNEVDYFETLRNESYLWSYGCGSGSHISAQGIGNTTDFANDSLLSVFTMLFGSQFGDWDNENNFLKAPLASGLTLTNVWAGNPAWYFHDMALGQHIGYSAQRTQNSQLPGDLPGPQLVHTALMGDPSLRMHPYPSVDSFSAVNFSNAVELEWTISTDPDVIGYYVYRSDALYGPYERVSSELVEGNQFTDFPATNGFYYYMLRAVKLETSGSGTYLNLSPGKIASLDFIIGVEEFPFGDIEVYPNPGLGEFTIHWENHRANWTNLSILDSRGKQILHQDITNQHTANFNLSHFPNGVYFVKLQSEKYHQLIKVVKME